MTAVRDGAVIPQLIVHCPICNAEVNITGERPFSRRICPSCGEVFDAPGTFSIWHLKGKLGHGRHTFIADAVDPVLERPLALKIYYTLHDVSEDDRAYFFRQIVESARKMLVTSHPCVVAVHDCRMIKRCPVLALERLTGATAAACTPGLSCLSTLAGVAEAMAVAEHAGISHGELYPGNFLVADENTWKITNFRVDNPFHDVIPCGEEPYVRFLSPETLIMGETGIQSDLFSFGASLYDRLTGRSPYRDSENWADYLECAAGGHVVPLSDRDAKIPDAITALVSKLLSPNPKDRGTFAEAAAILSPYRNALTFG